MRAPGRCQPAQRRKRHPSCCLQLGTDDPIERPDLAIYSQAEQMASGAVPHWDSPDILTNAWRPFRLQDEATVKVRNLSPTVSAVNALVHFSTAPFGIGMPKTLQQTRKVSLAPSQEVALTFPLDSVTLAGDPRVGVFVSIEHPQDAKAVNNYGEQVHVGAFTSETGRSISAQIPVLNNTAFPQNLTFEILPSDLPATVSPTSRTLAPFQQTTISLSIAVPAALSGTPSNYIEKWLTVVARRADNSLLGGATYLVRVDD